MSNIVRTTVYLNDIADFGEMNDVYAEFFEEPFPARTTVGAELRGIKIEIDAIAVRKN
jgi:enamine deaminase RidA (YjgF/YER057c/UK114 family)